MKKVPPPLCVLTNDAKTSAFFVFPSLAQSSQRGGEEAYKTFRDTTTSTVKCRHTNKHMDMYIHTVWVFHWGQPMKFCNLYRETINAHKRTHTINLEDTWERIGKIPTLQVRHT